MGQSVNRIASTTQISVEGQRMGIWLGSVCGGRDSGELGKLIQRKWYLGGSGKD